MDRSVMENVYGALERLPFRDAAPIIALIQNGTTGPHDGMFNAEAVPPPKADADLPKNP